MAEKTTKSKKDPEKIFLEKCKLYLSSSNTRQTPYAYFNIAPNTIVLSNSTSPPTNSELIHGDRLMNQVSGELGVHVVTFKNVDFYNEIITKFKVPQTQEIYWIQVNKLLTTLTNKKEIIIDAFGEMWVESENKSIGGFVSDIHVVSSILNIMNEFISVGTDEHQNKFTHLKYSVSEDLKRLGKLFMLDLTIENFVKKEQLLDYTNNRIRIPVIDGISTVDTKEFVKKIVSQKIQFNHELYIWARDNHSVAMISIYTDDELEIRSIRPYLVVVPMMNNFNAEIVNYVEDFKASQFLNIGDSNV